MAAAKLAARAMALVNSNAHGARRAAVSAAIKDFQRTDQDVGSPEVQIAILTKRIAHLTEHLKAYKKDKASARAIVALVNKRRSQMRYLLKTKPEKYAEVVKRLEIRPNAVFSKDVPLGAKKRATPTLSAALNINLEQQ